jgi:uncharacterized membrane protein (DUF373 family)
MLSPFQTDINPRTTFENRIRATISRHASDLEMVLYLAVGFLITIATIIGVFQSGADLWRELSSGANARSGLLALDQLLLVLMLIEILHTVFISIRTHQLKVIPFLIVGLIASIRRTLVITMQAAAWGDQGHNGIAGPDAMFRNSMIELGLMSILILVFVFSIIRLRAVPPGNDAESE